MSGRRERSETEALVSGVVSACRRGLFAAALFSLGVNILMLAVPLYMLQLFDRVLMSRSIDTLLLLSLIAGGALGTLALLDAVRGLLFARLGSWVERKLGGYVLAGHIATAAQRGQITVQGLRDLASIRSFLTGPGMIPLLDAPWIPIFLLAIFILHPVLGLVGVFGAVAIFALALGAEFATRRPVLRALGLAIETTDTAEGTVRNADVIEAMGMLPAVIRRWHQAQHETLGLQGKVARRSVIIGALAKFLRLGLQLGVFGIGAYLAIHNELTAGAMIAASILMGRALAPLEMAIGGWRSAVGAYGAYRRVRSQLEAAPIARPSMSLPTPHGALSVEAAGYTYPGQQRPLLKNVSFALGSGQALGILGPAGAGKTTLARLLAGTLRPQVGHVRLDGVEVAGLSPRDRLTAIGYIPQNVQLFRGSVRDNIARFEEATDQQVVKAAQLVGAHEMILHLPQGYETQVGEAGQALSGGQRQWIALARAVYAGPKLLVLDEPASSLDPQGEVALTEAVKRLKAMGMTIVIVAHRGPVLRQLDSLLLLRNGQVERMGSPQQLLPTLVAPATPAASGAGWPQFGPTGRHG